MCNVTGTEHSGCSPSQKGAVKKIFTFFIIVAAESESAWHLYKVFTLKRNNKVHTVYNLEYPADAHIRSFEEKGEKEEEVVAKLKKKK